jgi:D-inositol-3-phosphate glycosyltransferase
MRIALVSLHTSPRDVPGSGDAGGMNVVVAAAAQALAKRGHEVVAVTRANEALSPGAYELGAATLVALAAGAPRLDKRELPGVLPEFARQLETLGSFDAVHSHYWLSGLAALPLAAHSSTRLALTLHTVAAHKNKHLAPGDSPEPASRIAAERALTQAAFVIAGSSSELDSITAGYGAPLSGASVIHPGVDTQLFRPADSVYPADPLRITVLGRVQPLKGQDLAVRVFGELARRDPDLWSRSELVIAGEPTPGAEPYAAALRALADSLGVASRVRFETAQDRASAASLLASSAVVLVPSHSETFGLVALEAAACGVATIVAEHSGLLEAAGAGAVRMPDRDPAKWAAALRELLRDPGRRNAQGLAAREHAVNHSWNAHAAELERVYSGLQLR